MFTIWGTMLSHQNGGESGIGCKQNYLAKSEQSRIWIIIRDRSQILAQESAHLHLAASCSV